MAELKTKATKASVTDFLDKTTPEQKKKDAYEILEMFKDATGQKPVLWGTSIVGFGKYHYKSERSSQEGDWPLTGFSPRKQNLTLYVMSGFENLKGDLVKLGKHKTSVGCLYINKLADVDKAALKKIIKKSYEHAKKTLN